MGIIKAATGSLGGALADQWLEVIEPNEMSDQTVFTKGIKVRKDAKRGSNRKGTEDVITDGSIVHVYENMMMILVDGGKIIDYTAEPGYYTVKNDTAPSLFNGDLRDSIQESFFRFKFGEQLLKNKKFIMSIFKKLKALNLEQRHLFNTLIIFIMQSFSCVHMELIQ